MGMSEAVGGAHVISTLIVLGAWIRHTRSVTLRGAVGGFGSWLRRTGVVLLPKPRVPSADTEAMRNRYHTPSRRSSKLDRVPVF